MKQFLAVLLLLLCLFGTALADTAHIIDEADLFTALEEAELENTILRFQQETDMDFVILTTDRPMGSQQSTADNCYDNGGYGLGQDRSGALYYIDMYERIPYLSTAGRTIDYMTDERIEAAHDSTYLFLASGDYAGAAQQMIHAVYGYVDAGIPEGQYRYDIVTGQVLTPYHKALTSSEVLVCALIALVAALLFTKSVQGRYALKASTYSYDAASNSSFDLTGKTDDYLRTTTTRTRKAPPPSAGSHSGGSSHHRPGGSGVHHSSGGFTHGGGAGKRF
ncbi:MAG: TPM domain-containing protein [bacterium]|nr:TPM domain-containing protein [bacterium]